MGEGRILGSKARIRVRIRGMGMGAAVAEEGEEDEGVVEGGEHPKLDRNDFTHTQARLLEVKFDTWLGYNTAVEHAQFPIVWN